MSENPVFNMLFLMHDILPLRNLFSRVKWNSQIIIIIMARHATKGSKGSKGGAVVRALASHHNVARFRILASTPYVGWVIVGSLLFSERFFSGYSAFPLYQHLQIPSRSGKHGHVSTSS